MHAHVLDKKTTTAESRMMTLSGRKQQGGRKGGGGVLTAEKSHGKSGGAPSGAPGLGELKGMDVVGSDRLVKR